MERKIGNKEVGKKVRKIIKIGTIMAGLAIGAGCTPPGKIDTPTPVVITPQVPSSPNLAPSPPPQAEEAVQVPGLEIPSKVIFPELPLNTLSINLVSVSLLLVFVSILILKKKVYFLFS